MSFTTGAVRRLSPLLTVALASCVGMVEIPPGELPSSMLAPPPSDYTEAVEQARELVRSLMIDQKLPGLSVAVGIGDEIVWAEGFGWADLENRQPVTPKTRFRTGSTFKPVTAAAVGFLHEQGRIDLDASVQRYVPSFPEKRWPISTRQLMGHVAGVRHYRESDEVRGTDADCEDVVDGLAIFADDSLLFRPGTAYNYSSYGWNLVGAVVQARAGEPFLDFIHQNVFSPLGMEDTAPDFADRDLSNRATFYFPYFARHPRYGLQLAPLADQSCRLPSGGFVSTPSDLVRFGLAMLGGELLQPATIELLQTPQKLESGESTGYGLGWFIRTVPLGADSVRTTVFGHGGSSVGGTTSFMTYPQYGVALALTSNVSFAKELPALGVKLAGLFSSNLEN